MYIIELDSSLILIDPSTPISYIERNYQKSVKAILFTHGHFDHIDKLKDYLNKNIRFYMHKECMKKINDCNLNLSSQLSHPIYFNLENEDVTFVSEGSVIEVDGAFIKVMHTPGHSNCSVSYCLDDNIFTGDFLFQGSIGRTDFITSNTSDMVKSINRFKQITKDYNIYPGHGDQTTLNIEKVTNYYFK